MLPRRPSSRAHSGSHPKREKLTSTNNTVSHPPPPTRPFSHLTTVVKGALFAEGDHVLYWLTQSLRPRPSRGDPTVADELTKRVHIHTRARARADTGRGRDSLFVVQPEAWCRNPFMKRCETSSSFRKRNPCYFVSGPNQVYVGTTTCYEQTPTSVCQGNHLFTLGTPR